MEEKTLFTLRAPEIGKAADETQTVISDGGELLIKIRSRKQKIVNGKVVETTTPSCKVTMGESWLSSRVGVDNQYNILDVYFNIEENTSSSERTSVITVTQDESGKKLVIHIIQKAGVTYTDYLEVPSQLTALGNTKGSTLTIKVISYSLGSGGSTAGYLMIHGLGGQVTMSIPVTVNLSSYGNRTTADTGDRVTVWTSSGSTFSQIGGFTVPSAGGTVSI